MQSNSDLEMAEKSEQPSATKSNGAPSEKKRRKKRARLSCIECRKKKLSCDRNLPCQRCIRSGRPTQCSFETIAELQSPVLSPHVQQQEQQIRDLQAEITELKALLPKVDLTRMGDSATEASHVIDVEPDPSSSANRKPQEVENLIDGSYNVENSGVAEDIQPDLTISPGDKINQDSNHVSDIRLSDPRRRFPQGYYSRHALFQFFDEIHELFPFIKETAEEWLNPLGVNITKEKSTREGLNVNFLSRSEINLESVLPPKEDVDILVLLYLDGLEQLHRIIHIPTFKREYANFWTTQRVRYSTMTPLILAIIAVSSICATSQSTEVMSVAIKYRAMSAQWIYTCEQWLRQRSLKHRRPAHYQVSCLVYLAKRMSMTDKKKWWKDTSSLIQDAIIDGLQCDPSANTITPYMREMKRRIWAVLKELDLQNSYEYGLPSLLHNINSDAVPPTNLNDDDFSETSENIPMAKPLDEYTTTSYQVHSARSWSLRLEISQRLFSTGISKDLCYDDVLRYTQEITQAIESIPSWDREDTTRKSGSKTPTLAHAFLIFQLKTTILTLHRPYLHNKDGRHWLSETVCYHTSRDILLLNSKLAELGCQSLTMLREDLLLASLNLVRVTMLQPKGLVSVVVADYQSTIDLLEKGIPFAEDMHLRCCYSELWCFITLYAAILLLEIHLGRESRQTAKASCARRFLDLHHRQIERQKMSLPSHVDYVEINNSQLIIPDAPEFSTFDWEDNNYPELDFDILNFDVTMDGLRNI
ncbi:hypothetical protein F4781DRAFT_373264 [Annulohypoxylon bovei var. microspora]|nr:hypothetical protein F4781DRAFT_373264 [Annulohypoxylon bovei var. microspora]